MNKPLSNKERRTAQGNVEADIGAISLRKELLTTMALLLQGTAPLMVNNWSEKALEQLRASHTKQATGKKEAKNPEADFEAAKYRSAPTAEFPEGWEGVPAHGLKGAFVEGCRFVGGNKQMNMTVLKSALRVQADCRESNLLRLYCPEYPTMGEHKVRVGQGLNKTVDLRYRPIYWPWFVRVVIQFPGAMFSRQQIADLVRAAGAFNGFCEWRPGSPKSLTGSYGTFEIADETVIGAFEQTYGVKVGLS